MEAIKKLPKDKSPIHLRKKRLADGRESLYLDTYVNGRRSYEYLQMYLMPGTDVQTKRQNAETLQAAENIRAKRIKVLTSRKEGSAPQQEVGKMRLADLLDAYNEERKRHSKRLGSAVTSCKTALYVYRGNEITLSEIDKAFCQQFMIFLLNEYSNSGRQEGGHLAPATVRLFFSTLNSALNFAVRKGWMRMNPCKLISSEDRISAPESNREFLTIDEIHKLIATPFTGHIQVKRAYLFSCFCGLRISDVRRITWGDIDFKDGYAELHLIMQKTQSVHYLPLSQEACACMPKRAESSDSDQVFNLPALTRINAELKAWAAAAGIHKHITFHTARHTFATMMLTLGADLYTTSQLLGHSSIQTTQIYAKIVDKKKSDAVNLVNGLFS